MIKVIQECDKRLEEEEGLKEEEIYELKKKKLLAVQNTIYRAMEKNPHIFKIPQLIYRRKKLLKDKQFADTLNKSEDKLSFDCKQNKQDLLIKTKLV